MSLPDETLAQMHAAKEQGHKTQMEREKQVAKMAALLVLQEQYEYAKLHTEFICRDIRRDIAPKISELETALRTTLDYPAFDTLKAEVEAMLRA